MRAYVVGHVALIAVLLAHSSTASSDSSDVKQGAQLLCADSSFHQCRRENNYTCKKNATVSMQLCKRTCESCEDLAVKIQEDSDFEVSIVVDPAAIKCEDLSVECGKFVQDGLCQSQHSSMLDLCQASCKFCDPTHGPQATQRRCRDAVDVCPYWAATGMCDMGFDWTRHLCQASCTACPTPPLLKPLSTLRELQTDASPCADFNPHCERLASERHCQHDRPFMEVNCPSTCGFCAATSTSTAAATLRGGRSSRRAPPPPPPASPAPPSGAEGGPCEDLHPKCDAWAAAGGCALSATLEKVTCPQACGACRAHALTMQHLRVGCSDHHKSCDDWHATGECTHNAGFMLYQCPLACGLCEVMWTPNPVALLLVAGGVKMPAIGFGTAGLGQDTEGAVLQALRLGYRLIDSAQARDWYREDLVGSALQQSGVRRGEVFLTSKLHPRHLGYDLTLRQFQQSLTDLVVDYLDLFLLHYPECWGDLCTPVEGATWQDSWKALEALHAQGKVRAIGVSNFNLEQMQQLVTLARVPPAILQANSDPSHPNVELQAFCLKHGVQFQAYSSLGTQWGTASGVLTGRPVVEAARKLGATPAQVVLRWALQHGQLVIPRSRSAQHMEENLSVLSAVRLDEATMLAIDGMVLPEGVS